MNPLKKILLGLLLILLVAGGVHSCLGGEGSYDPEKYETVITPAPAQDEEGESKPAVAGLRVGSKVDLTLPDQFGVAHTIGPDTTTLIMAFTKGTGGLVRGYLDGQDAEFLSSHQASFIADISSIPTFVRNALALPKLRKSPYSVLLLYEKEQTKALKNIEHEDEIAIVTLSKGVVVSLKHIQTEEELAGILE